MTPTSGSATEARPVTILAALADPSLFAPLFAPAGLWAAWKTFLAALAGLPLDEEAMALYRECTGRTTAPTEPASEAWVIAGRRAGKSRIAALVAVFLACFRDYRDVLSPGEYGTVMVIATDRRQARTVFRYVAALLDQVPMLAALVVRRTREAIYLTNRIVIEVHTASYRSTRGYTVLACVCEEMAFWRDDTSANPDTATLNALRPAMATVPGALLLCISSPFARKGALWTAFKRHFGREGDPVLIWKAATRAMNPMISAATVEAAAEEDEVSARSEWGAEFRSDLEDYISREALEPLVMKGCRELGAVLRHRYVAFADPAGGSGTDSFCLAVAHPAEHDRVVLDLLLEARPPFSPEETVEEFVAALKPYRVRSVIGDKFGGDWVAEVFARHHVTYETSEQTMFELGKPVRRPIPTKSELYRTLLPLLNSRRVELLDEPRLLAQLLALERRTSFGGKETISHPPNGHDDCANVAAGALVMAAGASRRRGRLPLSGGGIRITYHDDGAARPTADVVRHGM